jgi:hypothetical protein
MIDKISAFLKEHLQGNFVALLIVLLGAGLVLFKHDTAGQAIVAGGLTHLQK